jgi:hypothetical protein
VLGTVWEPNTWPSDAWAEGTWGDAQDSTEAPWLSTSAFLVAEPDEVMLIAEYSAIFLIARP